MEEYASIRQAGSDHRRSPEQRRDARRRRTLDCHMILNPLKDCVYSRLKGLVQFVRIII